ncbi:1483_t:CDS:2, partial [Cetraspora pellucida]
MTPNCPYATPNIYIQCNKISQSTFCSSYALSYLPGNVCGGILGDASATNAKIGDCPKLEVALNTLNNQNTISNKFMEANELKPIALLATEKIAIPISITVGVITTGGITYYIIHKRRKNNSLFQGQEIELPIINKELPELPNQKNNELSQLVQQTKEKIGSNLI